MNKILMTYSSKEGMEKLFENPNFKIDVKAKPSPEQFLGLVSGYDGLIIRSEVKVTREVIEKCDSMKLIARAGTGVDNVDIKAATEKGIIVMNVPGGNTISACEHAFALMASLARNIPQAYNSLRSKEWKREKFIGTELLGKTIGVVGLGRIGREMSKRAIAFGMNVIGYDPFVSEDFAKTLGIQLCSLDEIYKNADIITLHIPKNEQTKNLINQDTLGRMKKGVRIINCARGGIIDEKALYEALKSGQVKGAAIDVFEKEPTTESPLFELDNVIVTPHLGASTEEAQVKISQEVSDMVIDYFQKGVIRNAVNIPSVDSEVYKMQKPYVDILEKIGSFQGQVIEGGIKEIDLEYIGDIPGNLSILTLSYLKGFLTPILDIKVNFVNANVIARERGIKIKEIKIPETKDYTSIVNARIITDREEFSMSGTILSNNMARIVNIKGLDVDITPQGCMIYVENIDKPGIIGRIGTFLGGSNINIARMQVGRKPVGGDAITIVNVDNHPSDETINTIARIDGVKLVKIIKL